MSDGDALFSAILAHPAEDTPRLAFADWLDEHSGPDRAACIRLQIEATHLPRVLMLPQDIGRYTQERAAFHEAAHAVYVWACNGHVKAIQVGYEDATREWHGATDADPLPNAEQAEMLLAGGFGEARYAANVYDPLVWQINEAISRLALVAAFAAPVPGAQVDITFSGPNNASKVIPFHRDTFSNDWFKAAGIAQQHQLNLDHLVRDSINRVNAAAFWGEVVKVANLFLLRPPRHLVWQYGYDNLIDEDRKNYRIAPIEGKVKQALGVQ